ncbi:hypothetical protein [Priestia aryabhattai]|uniref:hypothetical protein n=1 Tax=Priestia aryabhattai TaxID=412384 RepID=UPI002E1A2F71|nr:hypothetical protein [Priestia aryabhattai]
MKENDYFQNLLKRLCKAENISSRKPRFEEVEDLVLIHMKNHLKAGVDLECLKILNLIYQTVVPLSVKFTQQLCLYPSGDRLDRVTVSFKKSDYMDLNQKLKTGQWD